MPALIRPDHVPNRNREIVGHYLKSRRMELGLTQEELLKAIGSDAWFTSLSAIERGERNLPPALW